MAWRRSHTKALPSIARHFCLDRRPLQRTSSMRWTLLSADHVSNISFGDVTKRRRLLAFGEWWCKDGSPGGNTQTSRGSTDDGLPRFERCTFFHEAIAVAPGCMNSNISRSVPGLRSIPRLRSIPARSIPRLRSIIMRFFKAEIYPH